MIFWTVARFSGIWTILDYYPLIWNYAGFYYLLVLIEISMKRFLEINFVQSVKFFAFFKKVLNSFSNFINSKFLIFKNVQNVNSIITFFRVCQMFTIFLSTFIYFFKLSSNFDNKCFIWNSLLWSDIKLLTASICFVKWVIYCKLYEIV